MWPLFYAHFHILKTFRLNSHGNTIRHYFCLAIIWQMEPRTVTWNIIGTSQEVVGFRCTEWDCSSLLRLVNFLHVHSFNQPFSFSVRKSFYWPAYLWLYFLKCEWGSWYVESKWILKQLRNIKVHIVYILKDLIF